MKKYSFITITLVILGLVYSFPHLMVSPGNLYQQHSELKNNCFACHKVFSGTPNENCISCHKVSEIGLQSKKDSINSKAILFHKNLQNKDCISCHSEHKGLNSKAALSKFNHIYLNKKDQNNCISCHSQPKNELHKQVSNSCVSCHSTSTWNNGIRFNHSMIKSNAAQSNCILCHQSPKDDFHNTVKSTNNCLSCHTLTQWKPSTFTHNKYFVLDKNHSTDCKTCHTASAKNDFKSYTCFGCHEHSMNSIRNEHLEEGISNFTNCVNCHKSGNEDDIKKRSNEVENYIDKELSKNKEENDDD